MFQGGGAGKLCASPQDVRQSNKFDSEVPETDLAKGNHSSVHTMVVLVFLNYKSKVDDG